MCVAVALEVENRTAFLVFLDCRLQPHLAHTAMNLIFLIMGCLLKGLEAAPKFYQVAVAVLPIVKELEILDNFFKFQGGLNSCHINLTSDGVAGAPPPHLRAVKRPLVSLLSPKPRYRMNRANSRAASSTACFSLLAPAPGSTKSTPKI